MLTSKIKSRPHYEGLSPMLSARRHLIAAEGEGLRAARTLIEKGGDDFAARAELFWVAPGATLEALGPAAELPASRRTSFASIETLLASLDDALSAATMGTRLYVAGREGFIGRVVKLAVEHGMDHRSVLTEHTGSLARRVQCVHCKGFAEDVTSTIFECAHCGNLLLVRDHYSRRLAAFQGVCVNAEEPGSRPASEEAYR